MKYAVITFGCRVNQADSQRLDEDLRRRGCEEASPDEADLVVVNTCSVTASADQGARQVIRRIARANPSVRIVATGCYASRRPDELERLPNVVRVVRNTQKDTLADDVLDEEVTTARRYGGGSDACGDARTPGTGGRTALTLRVQTGCDQVCSYCIIPRTRGSALSTPVGSVLRHVELAVEAGFKEIVLTGVHLGSYGRDLGDGASLELLLSRLDRIAGDFRIRISSLEPMDCSREVVAIVARTARFAPHLHLPLQHGSDEMLRAMRRPYTSRFFGDLVAGVRDAIPWASIGTDVIVGFPGETETHVDELCALLNASPLSYLHVFPYSDRPGTAAAGLEPKVAGAAIRDRARRVRAIGAQLSARFRASQVGTVRRALTLDDGRTGLTDNFLKVALPVPQPRNSWVEVPL